MYGAEIWVLWEVDQKYLGSFEMWCWRRMEKISWTDRVRNEEVLHRDRGFRWSGGKHAGLLHPCLRVQTQPKPLDFYGRKNPQHAFLRRGSKRICPMSQLCDMSKNLVIYVNYGFLAKFQV